MLSKIDIVREQLKYFDDKELTIISLYLDHLYQVKDKHRKAEPDEGSRASVR